MILSLRQGVRQTSRRTLTFWEKLTSYGRTCSRCTGPGWGWPHGCLQGSCPGSSSWPRRSDGHTVHTERNVRPEEVIFSLKGLFEFIQWINYCYGSDEERFFDEKLIPKKRVQLDVDKIKQQESLLAIKDEKLKEMEKQLAAMAAELAAAKAVHTEQRSFNPEEISEYETRKRYIDLDLKLMGWKFKGTDGF